MTIRAPAPREMRPLVFRDCAAARAKKAPHARRLKPLSALVLFSQNLQIRARTPHLQFLCKSATIVASHSCKSAPDQPLTPNMSFLADPGPLPEHGTWRAAFLSRDPVPIRNVFASVAVKDLDSAVRWYEKLFNRPPSRSMLEVAEWSFERGGSLQVYQLPERAGSGSFTLVVTSIEEQVTQLGKLNIDASERTSGVRVKTIMITDPDGNHIAFAEAVDSSLAH